MRTVLNVLKVDPSLQSILPEQGCKSLSGFYYIYSDIPKTSSDLYIINFQNLHDFISLKELEFTPFLVYGKSSFISRSFSLGASDFLRTPFDIHELEARASRLINQQFFYIKEERIQLFANHISTDQTVINITESEYIILNLLIRNHNNIVTRDSLNYRLNLLETNSRVLDVYINSIRKKIATLLKDDKAGKFAILTLRGKGYTMNSQIPCG